MFAWAMDAPAADYNPPGIASDALGKLSDFENDDQTRRGRAGRTDSRLSIVWKLRTVWFLPLASESLLLLAAANLALALGKAMQGVAPGDEWIWLSVTCVLFVLVRLMISACELFMPRFVAMVGVGILGLVSLALMIGLLVPEPWHATFDGLAVKTRMLAAVPLMLFMFRLLLVLRAARFSPGLSDMSHYSTQGISGLFERIKKRLEFWMR
jgi:hypothetical protein